MSDPESDARWHHFWAWAVVVSVVFPIVLAVVVLVFAIPLNAVVIGLFVVDFFAIMASWHYSLKYMRRRSR